MTNYFFYIFSFILSYFFFKNYKYLAKKLKLIDNKNPYYKYRPTPTSAGILFPLIFILGIIFFLFNDNYFLNYLPNRFYIFTFSIVILSTLSFMDDRKSLDPVFR